jgi:hypothetical protein
MYHLQFDFDSCVGSGLKVTRPFYFGSPWVTREPTFHKCETSRLYQGESMAISTYLDGFRCTNDDSCSGIDSIKKSSNTIPIGGWVQSCSNYCLSEVPMGEARQIQPKPGTAEPAIVTAGLNASAYWNGIT